MKIQLDTTRKTIKIEESVKFSLLIDTLKKILPNNEWKGFTLETNTTIERWINPITYPYYVPAEPIRPWYESPWICNYSSTNQSYELKDGTYNLEVK
jgi:hypothetical protein